MSVSADNWGCYILGWVSAIVFWVVKALWINTPAEEEEEN